MELFLFVDLEAEVAGAAAGVVAGVVAGMVVGVNSGVVAGMVTGVDAGAMISCVYAVADVVVFLIYRSGTHRQAVLACSRTAFGRGRRSRLKTLAVLVVVPVRLVCRWSATLVNAI